MPPLLRCAVFDFDGTLIQSNSIKRNLFFEVANSLGKVGDIVQRLLEREPFLDRYAFFERLVAEASADGRLNNDKVVAADAEAAKLADTYTRLCESRLVTCAEVPGAAAALKQLADIRPDIKRFICSATPLSALESIVNARHMHLLVDGIYGKPKDKTENLQEILRKNAGTPEQMVVIGDSEDDRAAASAIGANFIGIQRSPEHPEFEQTKRFLVSPAFMIQDLTELPRTITEIEKKVPDV